MLFKLKGFIIEVSRNRAVLIKLKSTSKIRNKYYKMNQTNQILKLTSSQVTKVNSVIHLIPLRQAVVFQTQRATVKLIVLNHS